MAYPAPTASGTNGSGSDVQQRRAVRDRWIRQMTEAGHTRDEATRLAGAREANAAEVGQDYWGPGGPGSQPVDMRFQRDAKADLDRRREGQNRFDATMGMAFGQAPAPLPGTPTDLYPGGRTASQVMMDRQRDDGSDLRDTKAALDRRDGLNQQRDVDWAGASKREREMAQQHGFRSLDAMQRSHVQPHIKKKLWLESTQTRYGEALNRAGIDAMALSAMYDTAIAANKGDHAAAAAHLFAELSPLYSQEKADRRHAARVAGRQKAESMRDGVTVDTVRMRDSFNNADTPFAMGRTMMQAGVMRPGQKWEELGAGIVQGDVTAEATVRAAREKPLTPAEQATRGAERIGQMAPSADKVSQVDQHFVMMNPEQASNPGLLNMNRINMLHGDASMIASTPLAEQTPDEVAVLDTWTMAFVAQSNGDARQKYAAWLGRLGLMDTAENRQMFIRGGGPNPRSTLEFFFGGPK